MAQEADAARGVWRLLAALRHQDYRRYWIANTMAGAGVWALIVARGWLAYEVSGSSLSVGLVTFAGMIPFAVVPPFSGLLADRMDRRILVAIAHSVNVVLALGLAAITLWGDIQMWHLVVFALFSGIARGVQMPSGGALVATLVPRADLLNAIALNAVPVRGARLIGPLLASIVLAAMNVSGVFLLAAAMYALAAVQIMRVSVPARAAGQAGAGFWENLTAGLLYSYRNPSVGLLLLMVAFHCSLTMSFESVLPAFAGIALGAGGVAFSNLVMAVGGGSLVGVLAVAAIRNDRTKGRLLLLTGVLSGATIVALGFATSMPMALAAAVAMGATQATFMTLTTAAVQSVVPDAIRGRVTSLFSMSAVGIMALANLLYGALADVVAPTTVLMVPGSLFLLVIALAVVARPLLRRIFWDGMLAAQPSPAATPIPGGGAS